MLRTWKELEGTQAHTHT